MTESPGVAAGLGGFSAFQRQQAMERFAVLRPHIEEGITLAETATAAGMPVRTARRWLAAYRRDGLAGLVRKPRTSKGQRQFPAEMVRLIEGLALRRPPPSAATIHRQILDIAPGQGWPVPSYSTVYGIVAAIDPALRTLAIDGDKRYRQVFDLVYRRQAARANEIWQADHTQLDLWVVTPSGKPARPWLTVIEDDHSRAIAGYAVNLGAPSALNTALALRQAIWRKPNPDWHVCGIPDVLYTDHGSDFTSHHLEQVLADLKVRAVFSLPGRPRGRGKIERYMRTIDQMCLSALPGYAPRGLPDRAGQARLTLSELDTAIGEFIVGTYNQVPHSETGAPPQTRWEVGGFLPRLPGTLEQLDLLLLTVSKPRVVHSDGIHYQSLRYLDPLLADYVGEQVIIRYDPRDLAEIRVFHDEKFLCRAICGELAGRDISLKDITTARNARRRNLNRQLRDRTAVVDQLLAVHQPGYLDPIPEPAPAVPPTPSRPALKRYREE
ncbi:Mu transposase C-terminal domain-containing protein [Nocardia sp. 852002-20019_SCH5090214]|uniref:Mu transposase C-terminal domain-containing protein n=1 Tax=Nocardia sp. 852002-20019_SCH5090214 TaxID=1834087 RepID=UPI001E50C133|nr:Mu transposase C-terminal domain-containing protein [Nocardia sp. 852002-20019_SCH5090214]